jgi:hypothetical protein
MLAATTRYGLPGRASGGKAGTWVNPSEARTVLPLSLLVHVHIRDHDCSRRRCVLGRSHFKSGQYRGVHTGLTVKGRGASPEAKISHMVLYAFSRLAANQSALKS